MNFRLSGLVPAFAILAVGVAHAQNTGSMAYPQSLPTGQVTTAAPATRDTGSMAFPASQGGVSERAPQGQDTGNMASPMGRSAIGTRGAAPRGATMGGNPAMRPDVAPMAADSSAARNLSEAPSSAPIPYTSFDAPSAGGRGAPMMRRGKMMAHMGKGRMHHAMAHKRGKAGKPVMAAPAAAAPDATTATPAK